MRQFHPTIHQSQQIFTALILTGFLSLGTGIKLAQAATSNALENSQSVADTKQGNNFNLPESVTNTVLREASQRTGLSTKEIRIETFQKIQGSSSCLGIPPRPGELCTADLVPLWQVTVDAGQQNLVYHSNLDGSKIALNTNSTQWIFQELMRFIARIFGFSTR